MGFRKKDKKYNHTIMIKRAIEVNDKLRDWIFMNSNYRRYVWNKFVAEYLRCKKDGEVFDPVKYKTEYYNETEKPNNIYDTYCVGISEQVAKDMMLGLKVAKGNHGTLKFRTYDPFKCSFGVHCKPSYIKIPGWPEKKLYSRVLLIPYTECDVVAFRVRGFEEPLYIRLKERIMYDGYDGYYFTKNNHFKFSQEDIKQISFIYELGKFYVCLAINVANTYRKHHEDHVRDEAAGIDLGIHNPVCIRDSSTDDVYDYTKEKFIKYIFVESMDKKVLGKIHYLERRIAKLNTIMNRKTRGSKNYYKVLRKFRRAHKRIVDIRTDWRRKLSKKIALHYNTICVDTYEIPKEKDHEPDLSLKVIRKINHYNRMHGMYLFSETLKHACWKFDTKYVDSPPDTTRKCAACGHLNPHLPLSQRTFRCEKCNFTADRDYNAAQNCYVHILT